MKSDKQFKLVGVGGTFDILHRGHKALLRKALQIGNRVMVGVTSDRFVARMRKAHEVCPYSVRARGIRQFFQNKKALKRTEIVPIEDQYGPAATNPGVEALVVSKETLKTAKEINTIRRNSGLRPLKLIAVEMVLANDNKPISARRIRKGEITKAGRILRRNSGKRDSLFSPVIQ